MLLDDLLILSDCIFVFVLKDLYFFNEMRYFFFKF